MALSMDSAAGSSEKVCPKVPLRIVALEPDVQGGPATLTVGFSVRAEHAQ